MTPKRKVYQHSDRIPRSTITLLEELGLRGFRRSGDDYFDGRPKSFWLREQSSLAFILHDAHKAYRHMIKRLHPDASGNSEDCARLHGVWCRVKTLFARKGITL